MKKRMWTKTPSGETVAAQTEFVEGYATTVELALLYDDDFNVVAENPSRRHGPRRRSVRRWTGAGGLRSDGAAARLWVDVSQLRPMDEDVISAYIEAARETPRPFGWTRTIP